MSVVTLGCRLNLGESEQLSAMLAGRALTVVNSCAVTAEAVRQSRQAVRRAGRGGAPVYVTGCAATIDPAGFMALPGVTAVVANTAKLEPASYPLPALPRQARGRGNHDEGSAPAQAPVHTRAFVTVQLGCDHRCTFCVIPYGRGPSRSLPVAEVVDRIARLAGSGAREVVLTGVDLTSYGPDLDGRTTLGSLVAAIFAQVPDLPRLRLSSLDSIEVDPLLFELITREPRLMPQLHLSLQSGDDIILKRMKRRHRRAHAVEFCAAVRARRPEVAFGADLIAGFPTETGAMFDNSLALIADCGLSQLHVFPYSPRDGTPAARMPQIAPAIRRDRAGRLRAAGEAAREAWLKTLVGTPQRILVEGDGTAGHSEAHAAVRLDRACPRGSIVTALPLRVAARILECVVDG